MKVNEILQLLSREGIKESEVGLAYIGKPVPFSDFFEAILYPWDKNAAGHENEFVSGFVCFCFSKDRLSVGSCNDVREFRSKNQYLYLFYVDK